MPRLTSVFVNAPRPPARRRSRRLTSAVGLLVAGLSWLF